VTARLHQNSTQQPIPNLLLIEIEALFVLQKRLNCAPLPTARAGYRRITANLAALF
jgi:hypothetical protein